MKNNELTQKAAELFLENKFASTQLLCRRLDIPYNQASEIVEQLEQAEIVGPFSGKKCRELLIKNQQELQDRLKNLLIL